MRANFNGPRPGFALESPSGKNHLERPGLGCTAEHVVRGDELVEAEVMGDESTCVDLLADGQLEQRWCRVGVDQSGRDGHVPDPQLLEVQRDWFAVDADVGD